MSASISEVAKSTTMAASSAEDADKETIQGARLVQMTFEAINEVSSEISEVGESVKQLEIQGKNVTSVLDVIKSIADQTNLLALNAAIEAARAGDQGRGRACLSSAGGVPPRYLCAGLSGEHWRQRVRGWRGVLRVRAEGVHDDERERRAISWKYQAEIYKATPKPKNLLELRFEDMVLDQDNTLKKLEDYLGFPMAKIEMRPSSIGRWKTDEGKHYFSFFEEEMEKYGYNPLEAASIQ